MAERTSYTHGTPSWIDVSSTDPAASARFYGGLFGWEAGEPSEEGGGYQMFTKGGKNVAGMGLAQPGQPTVWSSYVTVDDADKVAAAAADAGGSVMMPPMDVLDAGRMAFVVDATGAILGLWQPNQHIGAELVNEPGTFCWSELLTSDAEKSTAFYSEVLGWGAQVAPDNSYTELQVGGESIAGMMGRPPQMPAEVPDHWMVYFTVDDVDAAVAKGQELGATVAVPAMDIPPGRFAQLVDPVGAMFAVIQFNEEAGGS